MKAPLMEERCWVPYAVKKVSVAWFKIPDREEPAVADVSVNEKSNAWNRVEAIFIIVCIIYGNSECEQQMFS